MSAKQVSLKSPVTIVVVMVLLVGVVALNVSTFGGSGRKNTSRGYRVQAHPPVPMDAGQLAGYQARLVKSPAERVAVSSVDGLQRDPFFPLLAQPKPVVKVARTATKKTSARRQKSKPLKCTAIMLGGAQSMAIINGEGRHPGDKIRGMTLTAIDADGVTFRKSNGSRVHLPVGVQEDKSQSFRVVTRTQKKDDQGRTHLVDQ